MPNVTLHLALADRVLDDWRLSGDAMFPAGDPVLVNAFRAGALGPDLGYFPGGPRFLSDLAHCVRTGDLARVLLRGARSSREVAFAVGWITHVVADRLLHPLIGRGVAVALGGTPWDMVAGADAPEAHIRVETGVDAWVSSLEPHLRSLRMEPVFDHRSIEFLQTAFQRVYGMEPTRQELLSAHQRVTRLTRPALLTMGRLADTSESREEAGLVGSAYDRIGRLFAGVAGFATERLGAGGMALALLTPIQPAPWLRLEVARVVEAFPRRIREILTDPRRGLPNVNLDTGEPEERAQGHPTTLITLQELERRLGHPLPRGAG